MYKENFKGNIYIFFPCYMEVKGELKSTVFDNKLSSLSEELKCRDDYELTSSLSKELSRFELGEVDMQVNDLEEESAEKYFRCSISCKQHQKTGLLTLLVTLNMFHGKVTHILDQISNGNLKVKDTKGKTSLLEKFIEGMFELKIAEAAKVCLSVKEKNKPHAALNPYLFASETFYSKNMGVSLKKEIYENVENIAQYQSSDIYCSNNTVLRVDKRSDDAIHPTESSDAALLFVIELVCLRFAAIGKSNKLILNRIKGDNVELNELYNLNESYGKSMRFWDFNYFKYFTAKNLATKICDGFKFDLLASSHEKNLQFLDYKINIKRAINDEYENRVVNLIAIIVFIFSSLPLIFKAFEYYYNGSKLNLELFFSGVGSVSFTILVVILVIKIIKSKYR